MARTVQRRTSSATPSGRRVVAPATGSGGTLPLDDRPLALTVSRDQRRLFVTLPHEVVVLDARDLSRQRSFELRAEQPSVAEDLDGVLWIGGAHLHQANALTGGVEKFGSKLGGVVDRVVVLRPGLLVGVGATGEMLWNVGDRTSSDATQREGTGEPGYRRKAPEREVHALVATPDERAVYADGSSAAWLVDPAHLQGYGQLRFKQTSPAPVPGEGIVALAITSKGRLVLGARDGGIAWTQPDLRLVEERFPVLDAKDSRPLAIVGDDTWIYVLRPRGLLQRFLIVPPKPKREDDDAARRRALANVGVSRAGRMGNLDARRDKPADEPPPPPPAQQVRLPRAAEAMALLVDDAGRQRLVLAGAHADGQLGRVWQSTIDELAWADAPLGRRELIARDAVEPATPRVPDFTQVRSKIEGPKLAELRVDDVVSGEVAFFVTHGHGSLLERPTTRRPMSDVLPGDALVVPAMLRMGDGTARPALYVWPASPRPLDELPEPTWIVWGDHPRGWMILDTPSIRAQNWSRTQIFPMQIALASGCAGAPGHRIPLSERWQDRELFLTLARECKKALVVVW
jgi:hypothetical protein